MITVTQVLLRNLDGDNANGDTAAVQKFGCVKLIRGATGADTEGN